MAIYCFWNRKLNTTFTHDFSRLLFTFEKCSQNSSQRLETKKIVLQNLFLLLEFDPEFKCFNYCKENMRKQAQFS